MVRPAPTISIARAVRGSRSRLTRNATSPPRRPNRIGRSHHSGFTPVAEVDPGGAVTGGLPGPAGEVPGPGPIPTSALFGSHALNWAQAAFHPSSVRG